MDESAPAITKMQTAGLSWSNLLSASPDAITALACLVVWIAPRALGQDAVKTLLLMMVMEFITVHATGFFTTIALSDGIPPMRRIVHLLALSLLYLLFIVGFSSAFHAWWPFTVFGWLVVGKIAWVFAKPRGRADELGRQMSMWAFSVVAYIGAVFAGLLLPLPQLGLDAATVASLHLPASGEWVAHPHKAVAGAFLYYALLAAIKGRGARLPNVKLEPA